MKRNLFILFLAGLSSAAMGQKISISGHLADSTGTALPSATVLLLAGGDSTLVNFSVADNHGNFVLKNVGKGDYVLKITSVGYRPYITSIHASEGHPALDLGTIRMERVSSELEAIEITADRPPVMVKKDTIEFNASSFKTRENAMVEDLLKKLPGIEVDKEGNVTAQGEQVKSVMVDGKKFFGNDPKLATRNLPADAIDKVQVFDKQSDQATFTGIDDGNREKTINLELKEDRRHALFGNLMAGGGTDERFEAKASLNKFGKGQQLSFLGMGNNVNQAGFGVDEYLNFSGVARQMMNGGRVRFLLNSDNANGVPLNFGNRANGIMSTYAAGANFNNELSKKTEVNGSYFYNHLDHDLDQATVRENFLENGNFTFREDKIENNRNTNHRANTTLDHRIDSANVIRFTANLSLNETDSHQRSSTENTDTQGLTISSSDRRYSTTGTNTSLTSALLYRHRFDKKGRSFSTNFQLDLSGNESGGILNAENTFGQQQEVLNQSNTQANDQLNYGATLSYTEPLGRHTFLEANYGFRRNENDVSKDVFDLTESSTGSAGSATRDEALSNAFASDYRYQQAGLNFRIAHADYNLVAGAAYQQTFLSGHDEDTQTVTEKTFTNVLPAVRFNFNFSDTRHVRFEYETNVTEPQVRELQPVVDNSDPLNIYRGNPALRPSYSHKWRINYASFSPFSFMSFFLRNDIDYTSNDIVNAQNIDEHLVRTITPVNVKGGLSIRNNANLGIPLKKLGSRFNLSASLRNSATIAVLNDRENDVRQRMARGTLQYTYEYKEVFDLTLSGSIEHQKTHYEFDQPDQTFINRTWSAESNLSFLKNYSFNVNVDYLVYENRSQDFEQRIPLVDVSVSRFLLKNKAGELKLGVTNLLDKSLAVEQSSSINYLERVTTNSLGRYIMLSFTYALNKQLNPRGMRGNHGPMMRFGG